MHSYLFQVLSDFVEHCFCCHMPLVDCFHILLCSIIYIRLYVLCLRIFYACLFREYNF